MSASYSEISFSQVAPRYNQINALPAAAAAQLGQALAGLLPPGATLLDMGCGAGRIALPAAAAGLRVTGLDRDDAMLAEAARSAAGLELETIHGDVTAMALPDDHFDAVFVSSVLHMVPAWQQALAEAARVMKPGGLFIQGRDWLDPASCAAQMRNQIRATIIGLSPELRPTAAASPAVMAQALLQAGGTNDPDIIAASWTQHTSPAALLDQIAAGESNETWMLGADLLAAVAERMRAWAASTWEDLDAPETIEYRFVLSVTRGLRG